MKAFVLGTVIGAATLCGLAGEPYADLGSRAYEYHGAAEQTVDPQKLDAIRLGLFVPRHGERAAVGLSLRRGAELAVIEANADGGFEGLPFTLVEGNDDQVWGSAREVVRLAYEQQVWAVIGGVGGESSHIVEQIVSKARLPMISPSSTDVGLTGINIPWVFRLMPDDDSIAAVVVAYLFDEQGIDSVAIVASNDFDHRSRAGRLEVALRQSDAVPVLSARFEPGSVEQLDSLLDRVASSGAASVVVVAGADDTVASLLGLSARKVETVVVVGPDVTMSRALDLGSAANGVAVVSLCDLDRMAPETRAFVAAHVERFGVTPDAATAYAYDGVRLVVDAIRRAGLNRAGIRETLAERSISDGVCGRISLDGSGSNTAGPVLKLERERVGFKTVVSPEGGVYETGLFRE